MNKTDRKKLIKDIEELISVNGTITHKRRADDGTFTGSHEWVVPTGETGPLTVVVYPSDRRGWSGWLHTRFNRFDWGVDPRESLGRGVINPHTGKYNCHPPDGLSRQEVFEAFRGHLYRAGWDPDHEKVPQSYFDEEAARAAEWRKAIEETRQEQASA